MKLNDLKLEFARFSDRQILLVNMTIELNTHKVVLCDNLND